MNQFLLRITALVILVISNSLSAQYSICDVPGIYYVDIMPDTIIDPMIGSNGSHYPADKFYELDMNQDGINDIKILSHAQLSNAYSSNTVLVSCLNPSFTIGYGNRDSTYNTYMTHWVVRDILKKYSSNDTIQRVNFVPTSSSYLAFHLQETGSNATSNQWVDSNDYFFGVRYANGNDTLYGWVKVNLSSFNNCTVKEHSFGGITNAITEFSNKSLVKVFPNPANDKIFIEHDFASKDLVSCILYDSNGKEIYTKQNFEHVLQTSELDKGFYYLTLECNGNFFSSKIVVSH